MIEVIKWSIFILVSIGILVFFWKSLERVYSHGFFRFFVFEAIMCLILVNSDYWFTEPFSSLQIVSWILLCGSLAMAIHGFYMLRITGKPKGNFENTSIIVKVGAYKYIRHPLYCSLLLLALGTFFKQISIISLFILFITIVFLIVTAKVEEHENIERFGTEYSIYAKLTKMFIPFVF
jgi:protein-S-isoprenylcysteine O-methyltransferase Ste14